MNQGTMNQGTMNQGTMRAGGNVLSAVLLLCLVGSAPQIYSAPPASRADLNRWQAAAKAIRDLHQPKTKSQRGEWLAEHKENGQTFAQYLAAHGWRVRDRYQTMYVQPFGDFTATQQRLLDATRQMLGTFYATPVTVLEPVKLTDLPDSAQRVHPEWGDRQLLSTYLLDPVLRERRPEDAVAVLGLTTSDLWPGKGWNFVFGQASLDERVGVWSLYRFGNPDKSPEDYQRALRRTLKVAIHETGHMLGIPHCTAYECCMNGSNHLDESDSRPLWFCPECEQKVWFTCRAEIGPRYAALAELAKQLGLAEEARFWRESEEAVSGVASRKRERPE